VPKEATARSHLLGSQNPYGAMVEVIRSSRHVVASLLPERAWRLIAIRVSETTERRAWSAPISVDKHRQTGTEPRHSWSEADPRRFFVLIQ